MEKNKDVGIENWIKTGIREVGLETPSDDFTHQVLSKLPKQQVEHQRMVYEPLISKRVWVLIVATMIVVFAYLLGNDVTGSGSTTAYFDVGMEVFKMPLDFSAFNFLNELHLSDLFIYAVLLFSFFFCIQFVFLKRFFERNTPYI